MNMAISGMFTTSAVLWPTVILGEYWLRVTNGMALTTDENTRFYAVSILCYGDHVGLTMTNGWLVCNILQETITGLIDGKIALGNRFRNSSALTKRRFSQCPVMLPFTMRAVHYNLNHDQPISTISNYAGSPFFMKRVLHPFWGFRQRVYWQGPGRVSNWFTWDEGNTHQLQTALEWSTAYAKWIPFACFVTSSKCSYLTQSRLGSTGLSSNVFYNLSCWTKNQRSMARAFFIPQTSQTDNLWPLSKYPLNILMHWAYMMVVESFLPHNLSCLILH